MKEEGVQVEAKNYRWVVLMAFVLLAAVQQVAIVGMAPLISLLQERYGVGELMAGTAISVIPLCYLVVGLHSGAAVDRYGYKRSILAGGAVLVLATWFRALDLSFWMLLLGQVGIGLSQAYVVNAMTKLVADWFPKEQAAMATGFGTVGVLSGMTLGYSLTPVLVNLWGFQSAMVVIAVASSLMLSLFALLARENHCSLVAFDSTAWSDMRACLKHPEMVLLCAIAFLYVGTNNGLPTWLGKIMAPNGFDAEQAGMLAGLIFGVGTLSSLLVPGVSDRLGQRKPFVLVSFLFTLLLIYPLCISVELESARIIAMVLGFFWLPAWAILLTMSEEIVGSERAGMAMGLFMLAGQLGMFANVYGLSLVKNGDDWFNAVALVLLEVAVILVLVLRLPETFGRDREAGETVAVAGSPVQ